MLIFFVWLAAAFFPQIMLGGEVVAVIPFVNQRYTPQHDGLGFYIQARIRANYKKNANWRLVPLSVLRLWQSKSDTTTLPVSDISALIGGTFQRVGRHGIINLVLIRFLEKNREVKTFELKFDTESLDEKLDDLSQEAGKAIKSKFILRHFPVFPRYSQDLHQEVVGYNRILFLSKTLPTVRRTISLMEQIDHSSPPDMIAILAEGMLILSQKSQGEEKKELLTQAEKLLRRATGDHRRHSQLHALLAETYWLMDSYPQWVEKTAEDALKFDAGNDLAALMLAVSKGLSSGGGKEALKRLNRINPWIWPRTDSDSVEFQKGIMKDKLKTGYRYLKEKPKLNLDVIERSK